MQRSGKYYRKNEAEVMKQLGLRPTKNSGSGWVEKEDGQSDEINCQLKSTDAQSIKIDKKDLDTLQYNAVVSHKLPVFAIQFLCSNEVYVVLKPEMLAEIAQYIETGEISDTMRNTFASIDLSVCEDVTVTNSRVIKSSSNAREEFNKEHEKKFKKVKRSAV